MFTKPACEDNIGMYDGSDAVSVKQMKSSVNIH